MLDGLATQTQGNMGRAQPVLVQLRELDAGANTSGDAAGTLELPAP